MRPVLCGIAACLVFVATGCAGSSEQASPPPRGPFAYDSAQPLRFTDRGRVNTHYPIAIHDVSYAAGRDRIAAFLVLPPSGGKRLPAVIYVHGSGGDRKQLVVPATWLASRHAVGLVITAPSATATAPRGRLAQGRASPAGPARGARRDRRPPGDRPPPPAA